MPIKVRFVNPQRQFEEHGKEIMAVLEDRIRNGQFILRDDVTDFEARLAKMCGTKYAVGVNSGFDAIFLSLEAAGIGPGDEVITVAHTFLATISAIVKLGATPVLVDIGEDWNMNPSLLKKAITKKARAIIPVHLNGRVCDMETIMAIARAYKLLVIEDACQSLSATFKGKKAGSFGFAGCFSFYPFKILGAFGEAGAVVTNSKKLRDALILSRYHGVDRTPARRIHTYGWNAVIDNIQAAVLNVKLEFFHDWIKRRQAIARIYQKGLRDIPGLKLPHFSDTRCSDVYQNYVIQTPKRNALRAHLEREGIETIISWPTPLYRNKGLRLPPTALPMTEKASREVLSLPLYPELTNTEVQAVIGALKNFYD